VKRTWKRIRYRLEWLAVVAALKLVPLLSRNACYQLGGIAGALAAVVDRRGRAVALANLQAAFGSELTAREREKIARDAYQHFARAMLDLFWSPRLTRENFRRYIELSGVEESRSEMGPGGSCIFGVFHYSNFEWLGLSYAWLGFNAAIVAEELKNPLLDEFFAELREQSGHEIVPRQGAIVRLYKVLRKRGRIALFVDTTLPAHHPTVVIECFGLKTMITVAHAWLQEQTGAPLIPAYCEPLPGGRYRLVALPKVTVRPGATHQEIAQACWDSFAPIVRRNPAPWLWMYKHWRYKPVDARRPYPFYSQESPFFEQIASRPNYEKLDRSRVVHAAQPAA
jgi:lauroyl/myristoyl acyltransferase